MQIWEMAMCVEKAKRAPVVFFFLEGKARETVLELDIAALSSEDGMEKVYEKLSTLFLEDINQFAFLSYETFSFKCGCKCFKCGCKFHWSYDCPYIDDIKDKHENCKKGSYLSLSNIIMMSQHTKWKESGNTFSGETLGSAVLDIGASGTVCGTKWYECFLETLTNAQRKKLLKKE